MKRLLMAVMFMAAMSLASMAVSAHAAGDDVCGNSFGFFYDEVLFLIKFESANPDLPCVSGVATLYWQDSKREGSFVVDSKNIVKVSGIGKFVLDGSMLYFLDSASIVFDEY